MAVSQNSYPANDRACIHTLTVPGTSVRLPVRKGPAGDLLIWAAARWHREVEPLTPGWNWGFAERTIRGSATVLSNHASGTAIDLNAPKHPLGVPASRNFTPAQIDRVHRIIDDAQGCLRWGGDYDNPARGGVKGSRPDPMHIEVVASEARCAAVLGQGSSQGSEDDDLTPEQAKMLGDLHALFFTKRKPWGGGISNIPINNQADLDRAEPYTVDQFWMRDNVESHQANNTLSTILRELVDLKDELSELKQRFGVQ